MRGIAKANKEVASVLVDKIKDAVASKIEREEEIWKIGWCLSSIAKANKEVAMEFINRIDPELRERVLKIMREMEK